MASVTVGSRELTTIMDIVSKSYTGLQVRSANVIIDTTNLTSHGGDKDILVLLLKRSTTIYDFVELLPYIYESKTNIDYTYDYALSLIKKKALSENNTYVLTYKNHIDEMCQEFVSLVKRANSYINNIVQKIEFDKIPKSLALTIIKEMIQRSDHIAWKMSGMGSAILDTINTNSETRKLYANNIHKMFDLPEEDFQKVLKIIPPSAITDMTQEQLSLNRTFVSVEHANNVLSILDKLNETARNFVYEEMAYRYNLSYWDDYNKIETINGILDIIYTKILKDKRKYSIDKGIKITELNRLSHDIKNIYHMKDVTSKSSKAPEYIIMALKDLKEDIEAIPNNDRTFLVLLYPFISYYVTSWTEEYQEMFYSWIGTYNLSLLLGVYLKGGLGSIKDKDAYETAFHILKHVDVCVSKDASISDATIAYFKSNHSVKDIKNAAMALMLSV